MTSLRLFALAAASGAALAACQTPAPKAPALAPPAAEVPLTVGETPMADTCAVLEARNWEAWINRMPGPNATAAIHVVGQVDVPTGGYTFDWKVGPMDRAMTPALKLDLIPLKPNGMATMAITPEEVHYVGPLAGSAYRSITVTCGGQTLAEITEIPDAV